MERAKYGIPLSLRLLYCGLNAKGKRQFRAYHDRVFERFCRRELDIEDAEAIAYVLSEVHANRTGFRSYLAGAGRIEHDTVREFAEAAGVFDVPSFIAEGELFWGREHLADIRENSLRWLGFNRTSPVTAFPPNLCGVHDMIGNVWEWTTDWYSSKHAADPSKDVLHSEILAADDRKTVRSSSVGAKIPRKVIKGGSHLCAPNYCRRYRPAARHAEDVDTSTSHLGFRCIIRQRSATIDQP